MGICVSTRRSTLSDGDVSEETRGSISGVSGQRANSVSRSRSPMLSSLPAHSRRTPEREFPHEVADAATSYMDSATLARFALTSRATLHRLADAQRRMEAIGAAAEEEIQAFANAGAEALDVTSPALRNIGELPSAQRADLLARAITAYILHDNNPLTFEASRNRFALLCQQLGTLHDHPRFSRLAAGLVQDALPKTYASGQAWQTVNTDEPLRQALQVIVALPMRQRGGLADFMRNNVVHMILPADRTDALRAINGAIGSRRSSMCGVA